MAVQTPKLGVDFWCVDTNSGKLKITLTIFWWWLS